MTDFSEISVIGILADFLIVFLVFITSVDAYYFFKKRERFVWLIVSFILLIVSLITALVTSVLTYNCYALILCSIFLVTLLIGLKFKKTVSIFWVTLVLLIIGFVLSFFYSMVLGEEGKTLMTLKVEKINGLVIDVSVTYKNQEKKYTVKGEMIGFESFQMFMKPYLNFLLGQKRLVVNSVFSESFNEDHSKGEVFYYPVGDSLFDRKKLWVDLEKKRLLLIGVKGVQRIGVSVYPEQNAVYDLKMTNQGLLLVKR